jgi:hypothetical protein
MVEPTTYPARPSSAPRHDAGPWHIAQVLDELWRAAPLAALGQTSTTPPRGPRSRLPPQIAATGSEVPPSSTALLRVG